MGQYYMIVNLDKRQFISPWTFGDGAKLLEFGMSRDGLLCGLAILLADGNGRGGGDLHSDHPIVGTWAGDRIVIAGDYADPGKFLPTKTRYTDEDGDAHTFGNTNLYRAARDTYTDISFRVMEAMLDDAYLAASLAERVQWNIDKEELDPIRERLKAAYQNGIEQGWIHKPKPGHEPYSAELRPDITITMGGGDELPQG